MTDDNKLVADLINPGTQNEAFRQLIVLYQKPLYNIIRNIVLNHDDADDVLQNTFIKIFRNIENFKGESKLFSWLYRIATNEALTFIKQKSKMYSQTSEEFIRSETEKLIGDEYFDGDEIQLKLQKAISLLPEKQQLVFKMKYFEELTYENISEITETSVGALKASYHHAVKKIEDYINNH
ncbi:MAG: sigma-70 family RNA polymerase sigma factor [Flavobacteriaceae bacterium]|nr:sigma-70 family RNA polymerase sigma factor [Flavobacteriaceae bacterium]